MFSSCHTVCCMDILSDVFETNYWFFTDFNTCNYLHIMISMGYSICRRQLGVVMLC